MPDPRDLTDLRDRARGCLLGLAVGDALGTTVEFSPPGTFAPLTDVVGGGPFDLPAGAWTDDTAMALCLADSLIARGGHDPGDQLARYLRWYRHGERSATGECFDIGNATRASLERHEGTGEPHPGDAFPQAAGNGSLMRLAPVPIACVGDPARAAAWGRDGARTTHGARQATDATAWFAALLARALAGEGREDLLDAADGGAAAWPEGIRLGDLHPEVAEVVAGSYRTRRPPEIRGTGYVVRSLEAALWAVSSTDTFADAVLAAANLGDDADTTAAIAGQLAGALHGAAAIPPAWRERVHLGAEITGLADALLDAVAPAPPAVAATRRFLPDDPRRPDAPPGESWWVEEPRLLAGPYPGHPDRATAERKLEAFLDAGITVFVDLTEHGEGPRGGPALHPYEPLLRRIAKRRSRAARAAHGPNHDPTRIGYVRLPIADVDVPPRWQLHATLRTIDEALAADQHVYVHCWGGVGRTGTVIAARLVEQGRTPRRAIEDLARLRRGAPRAGRPAPEARSQVALVGDWLHLGSDALRPEDVPDPSGPYDEIIDFAHRFDGYRYFGGPTGSPADPHVMGPMVRARAMFGDHDHVPADLSLDELRAVLFLHFRGQRFGADDEVVWVPTPDGRGAVARNPPDPEADPPRRFQRALVRRIAGFVASGERAERPRPS